MAESKIITFAGDTEIKATLEGWAKEQDRSVSWIVRKLIEAEKVRRTKQLSLALTPALSQGEREEEISPTEQMRHNGAAELIPIR